MHIIVCKADTQGKFINLLIYNIDLQTHTYFYLHIFSQQVSKSHNFSISAASYHVLTQCIKLLSSLIRNAMGSQTHPCVYCLKSRPCILPVYC